MAVQNVSQSISSANSYALMSSSVSKEEQKKKKKKKSQAAQTYDATHVTYVFWGQFYSILVSSNQLYLFRDFKSLSN